VALSAPMAAAQDAVTPASDIPYPLYAALDLAKIPWHNSAGDWGARVMLEAPAQPVTTRAINVGTPDEFNAAASINGRRINVIASWRGDSTVTINASDIDVVIPAGISIGGIELGVYPRETPLARIRIRGDGRIGQYRDFGRVSDVTIDGIDMNGDSGFGGSETNQAFRISSTRVAVLNVRAIAAGYVWLGNARHVVIANTNLFHGASTAAHVRYPGAWGIRNTAGPITIVDSRIQGTRYNNLRAQSTGGAEELLYVARTTFVNTAEGGRVAWLWDNLGSGGSAPNANGQGAIIEDSAIFSYGAPGCGAFADLRATNAAYSRIRRNQFFSGGTINWSQTTLNRMEKLPAGDHDWTVGNTFMPLTALPPWSGPGDPTQIPLPRGLPLSISGADPCTSPY
jgi:hypothetical protein